MAELPAGHVVPGGGQVLPELSGGALLIAAAGVGGGGRLGCTPAVKALEPGAWFGRATDVYATDGET